MEEYADVTKEKIDLPEPNPVTQASHRKEFFRQVWLPFGLFLLLSITAGVLFIVYDVGTVESWSQIATMLLVVTFMVIGLLTLVLLVGLVIAVTYLLRLLPPYTRMAQEGIETIKTQVTKGADITAKPVIQIQSFLAVLDTLFSRDKAKE